MKKFILKASGLSDEYREYFESVRAAVANTKFDLAGKSWKAIIYAVNNSKPLKEVAEVLGELKDDEFEEALTILSGE